jgi:hypothetical protein
VVLPARKQIALIGVALAATSFYSFLIAQIWYSSTRPTEPHPELGRVYGHHLKNSATVYLTAPETTGLTFLLIAFLVGFGLMARIAASPERNSLGEIKEYRLTRRDYIVACSSALSYILIVIFFGPILMRFATSHGIIMTWATDYGH